MSRWALWKRSAKLRESDDSMSLCCRNGIRTLCPPQSSLFGANRVIGGQTSCRSRVAGTSLPERLVEKVPVIHYASKLRLRQNVLDHMAGYVCESESSTVVFVRQAFMVHSQQMQNRRVQVVEVNAVLDRLVANFI